MFFIYANYEISVIFLENLCFNIKSTKSIFNRLAIIIILAIISVMTIMAINADLAIINNYYDYGSCYNYYG